MTLPMKQSDFIATLIDKKYISHQGEFSQQHGFTETYLFNSRKYFKEVDATGAKLGIIYPAVGW